MTKVAFDKIASEIQEERNRIRAKRGTQTLAPEEHLSVLVEKVGRAAQALNSWKWDGAPVERVRKELIRVGAVAADMRDRLYTVAREVDPEYKGDWVPECSPDTIDGLAITLVYIPHNPILVDFADMLYMLGDVSRRVIKAHIKLGGPLGVPEPTKTGVYTYEALARSYYLAAAGFLEAIVGTACHLYNKLEEKEEIEDDTGNDD